jgi:hypothetical protein
MDVMGSLNLCVPAYGGNNVMIPGKKNEIDIRLLGFFFSNVYSTTVKVERDVFGPAAMW